MQKDKSTTAAAGIAGAIIGAGLTAAAVALKDKDTRKRVKAQLVDVKKHAEKVMHDTAKKVEDKTSMKEKVMDEAKDVVDDVGQKTERPLAP